MLNAHKNAEQYILSIKTGDSQFHIIKGIGIQYVSKNQIPTLKMC